MNNSNKNISPKLTQFFLDKNNRNPGQGQVKSTKNLNISLGSNDKVHNFNSSLHDTKTPYQSKQEPYRNFRLKTKQQDQNSLHQFNFKLNSVVRQNQKLKQQNQILKKELSKIKKLKFQPQHINSKQKYKVYSTEHSRERQSGDLRGTIKKQFQQGDLKQLKIKLQILSKQCKMYEQIIDKMQNTIRKLTDQNKNLNSKNHFQQKHSQKDLRKDQFQNLKQKVNLVMKQYSDLQSKMHSNELQWVIWKQQWITQKNIYLNKIRQLQIKIKEKKQN